MKGQGTPLDSGRVRCYVTTIDVIGGEEITTPVLHTCPHPEPEPRKRQCVSMSVSEKEHRGLLRAGRGSSPPMEKHLGYLRIRA